MHHKQRLAYALLFGAALAAGVAVAIGVMIAIGEGPGAAPVDSLDLVGLVVPAAVGLAVVVGAVEVGLRRLGRSRAKPGW